MSATARKRPRVIVPFIWGNPEERKARKRKQRRRARALLKVLRREGLVPEGKEPPLVNLFDIFLPNRPGGVVWYREAERRKVSQPTMDRLARATAHLSREDLSDTLAHVYGELGENQYAHR